MENLVPPPCPICGGPRVRYNGSSPRCKPCLAAKMRRRYQTNEQHRTADNARSRAWREANRERHRELVQAWREANKERIDRYNRLYYSENRETEIARSLAYTKANPHIDRAIKQRREALKREAVCEHGPRCVSAAFMKALYGAPCTYCGAKATEADHYKPLSRGGLHCRDNIVPACKSCNCSKNARDPEEWLASRVLLD
ncbi:MAG: HNH endonuclease [Blastococcus sp.]